MKILSFTLVLILFASTLFAAPFLVCDPYPTSGTIPTYFSVSVDGAAAVDSPAVSGTLNGMSGIMLRYDLVALARNVEHTIKVKTCSLWGCSEETSIGPFSPSVPAKAGALSIISK